MPPGGELALGAVAVLGAAMVQGVTGFAFGILAVSFLTVLWDIRTANVVVSCLACWNVAQTLYSVRQGVVWKFVGLLMIGIVAGQPLGAVALVDDRLEVLLLVILGLACLAVAAQELFGPEPHAERPGPGPVVGVLAGVVSGFLVTSVSSGGPPVIWYIYRFPLTKEQLKATCLTTFAFGLVIKFGVWARQDLASDGPNLLTPERLKLALVLLPAAVIGSTIGIQIFRRVDVKLLRKLICVLLVGLAVSLGYTAARKAGAATAAPASAPAGTAQR